MAGGVRTADVDLFVHLSNNFARSKKILQILEKKIFRKWKDNLKKNSDGGIWTSDVEVMEQQCYLGATEVPKYLYWACATR